VHAAGDRVSLVLGLGRLGAVHQPGVLLEDALSTLGEWAVGGDAVVLFGLHELPPRADGGVAGPGLDYHSVDTQKRQVIAVL